MKFTKTFLYLLLIVVIALIPRIISAQQVDIGTDEMIYSLIPLNIISAHRLSTVEQAPLYFYLVDLSYKVGGGLTLLTTRLPSIIFGAFSIFIIFLIAQELFQNKKAALLSALLFALSGYAIRHNQEMDMTAFFFALLSLFFFIKMLQGNYRYLYLSVLFLAIATLAKPIVLLFAPAYLLVWFIKGYHDRTGLFYRQDKKLVMNSKVIKTALLALLLAVIIVAPVLVYNHLLYKEKGITDYYFSVLAGVGSENNIYQGQEAEAWTISRFFTISGIVFSNLFRFDAILLVLGVIGIIFSFRKEKYNTALLVFSVLLLFMYLAGKMSSSTHYVWLPLILSIFAGQGAIIVGEYLRERFRFKHAIAAIILFSMLSASIVVYNIIPLKETSIALALREYAHENIPDDAIVILDPRIYRGIFAWSFNDRHYLEGTYFPELYNTLPQLPGERQNLPLYYIECAPGTYCGWKPEDYQRIAGFGEQLSAFFKNQTVKIAEIKAVDTFIVYQGLSHVPLSIYEVIDRTHVHWYTPIGWKYPENAVDNYTPKTVFDKILNSSAFVILYADVLIALMSLVLVLVLPARRSD